MAISRNKMMHVLSHAPVAPISLQWSSCYQMNYLSGFSDSNQKLTRLQIEMASVNLTVRYGLAAVSWRPYFRVLNNDPANKIMKGRSHPLLTATRLPWNREAHFQYSIVILIDIRKVPMRLRLPVGGCTLRKEEPQENKNRLPCCWRQNLHTKHHRKSR